MFLLQQLFKGGESYMTSITINMHWVLSPPLQSFMHVVTMTIKSHHAFHYEFYIWECIYMRAIQLSGISFYLQWLWWLRCDGQEQFLQRFHCLWCYYFYRSPFSSPDPLCHCCALWQRQHYLYNTVAAPTVWWWGSSQLHYNCQSWSQSTHHQCNKCSSHSALQCNTHCQYCGHQLQWEQQCYHADHWHWYVANLDLPRFELWQEYPMA